MAMSSDDDGFTPISLAEAAILLGESDPEPAPPVEPAPATEPVTSVVATSRTLEQRLAVAQEMGLARNLLKQLAFIGPGRSRTIEIQVLAVRRSQGDSFERVKSTHALTDDQAVTLCTEADSWFSHGIYFLPARLRAGVDTRNAPPGQWFDLPKGGGTTDNDIEARLILPIDFDVKRPAGISATDEELARSVSVAAQAWKFLESSLGGTDSMALLHSGNGRHIDLALDSIAADDESKNLVASILVGMDVLFSTDAVKVDKNLFDSKRILPACGTLKKKGAPGIDERPHRRTAIVTPDTVKRITLDELKVLSRVIYGSLDLDGQLAMHAASGKRLAQTSNVSPLTPREDSPFGRANSVSPAEVAAWLGLLNGAGEVVCPGCSNTQGVSLLRAGLKCFHNTCSGKGMKGRPGFRTNIDLTMEVRGVDKIEAVKMLGDRFGFDGTVGSSEAQAQQPTAESQGQMQTPPLPAYSSAPIYSQPAPAAPAEPRWRSWTPEEIYADLPPIDWLIEGVMPRGTVGVLAAYGSSLKSWAALDLLDSIACGKPWLDRFKVARKGRAYLVDFESGSYEVRRRLQYIARGRRMMDPVEGLGFVSFPPDFITTPAFIAEVTALADLYDVIIIDTLAAGSPGTDENDTRFAGPLNLLKGISEKSKTRCTFLVLHHTRKQREGGEDDREGTRGTSAIFNALDWELKLFKFKNDGSFTCRQTKARQGKKVDPFVVEILEPFPDTIIVRAKSVTEAEAADDPKVEFSDLKKEILALIAAEPGIDSASSVGERVKKRKSSVLTAIREMVRDGDLLQPGGENTPFFLPFEEGGSQTGTGSQKTGTGSRFPLPVRGGTAEPPPLPLFPEPPPERKGPPPPTKAQVQRALQAESDALALELIPPRARGGYMIQEKWGGTRKEGARSMLALWESTARSDVEVLAEARKQGLDLRGKAEELGWLSEQEKIPKRFERAKSMLPAPNKRMEGLLLNEAPSETGPSRAKPEEPPLSEIAPAATLPVAQVPVAQVFAALAPSEPPALRAPETIQPPPPAPEAMEPEPVNEQAERDADALQPLSPQDRKALTKDWTKQRRWEANAALKKREPF